MIDRRRWPKPTPGAGPDAAAVGAAMGEHVGHRAHPRRIDGLGNVGWKMPAMPHISGLWQAGGPVGKRRRSGRARQEGVDRRARADAFAGRLAETSTATARCGPPSRRTFIVSSFTASAAGEDIADAVEAATSRTSAVGGDPVGRPPFRRRRRSAVQAQSLPARPRPGRSRPARAPLLAGEDGDGEIDLLAGGVAVAAHAEEIGAGEVRLPGRRPGRGRGSSPALRAERGGGRRLRAPAAATAADQSSGSGARGERRRRRPPGERRGRRRRGGCSARGSNQGSPAAIEEAPAAAMSSAITTAKKTQP
jgi:hypothetical protein